MNQFDICWFIPILWTAHFQSSLLILMEAQVSSGYNVTCILFHKQSKVKLATPVPIL